MFVNVKYSVISENFLFGQVYVRLVMYNDGNKSQFECEKKHIGKSGIVTPSAHPAIVEKVLGYLTDNGLYPHGIVNAPVRKGKNVEYILHCKPQYEGAKPTKQVLEEIKCFVRRNSLGELE